MSEPMNDANILQPAAAAPATVEVITPVAEVKSGVQDFEAAMKFVVDGVEKLGDAAKDELISLAKKYL